MRGIIGGAARGKMLEWRCERIYLAHGLNDELLKYGNHAFLGPTNVETLHFLLVSQAVVMLVAVEDNK